MNITKEGELFIINEETGGKAYYERVYKNSFIWPEGESGATAMVGIDIGYYTSEEIDAIFKPLTSKDELALIQNGRGKKGIEAKKYVPILQDIKFSWEEAIEVFETFTLPKFSKLTERVFPGVDNLHTNAQTAILSLVFNRGTRLTGESRREMAEIRKLIPAKNYKAIANQIKLMKRLWAKGNGLLGRRDREAALVMSSV